MWRPLLLVLLLTLSTLAIRVPVNGRDNTTEVAPTKSADNKQDIYYVSDEADIDSYLVPPSPHRPEQVLPDLIVTPATYLLPPPPDHQVDHYAPPARAPARVPAAAPEAGRQTDWYPIALAPIPSTPINLLAQNQPELIPIYFSNESYATDNPRNGKAYEGDRLIISLPSRQLEPPSENAPDDYKVAIPPEELDSPSGEINLQFDAPTEEYQPTPKPNRKFHHKKKILRIKQAEPTLALHLTPPEPLSTKYKNPTKLYPKKVSKGFQPIPIPIAQPAAEPPPPPPALAEPANLFEPVASAEYEYITPSDEKRIYIYEQAEEKRKLKEESDFSPQQQLTSASAAAGAAATLYGGGDGPAEQETSETNYRHPARNAYPAPLRQAPPAVPPGGGGGGDAPAHHAAPNERTEFRMHGMKGPHSYQFGFDTGKGKNRQFRYEERDNAGRVRGHYGYMDRGGKLRVVNYDADPERGFHAEPPREQEYR